MGHSSAQQVIFVKRTRNDAWVMPSVLCKGVGQDDLRLSPNRFHIDYENKKGEIKQL